MTETDTPASPGPKASGFVRRYLWHGKIWTGLLVTAPALFGFLGSLALERTIDVDLKRLEDQRRSQTLEMISLQNVTRDFETYELLRGSFLLSLTAANAEDRIRYTLDQFYRAKAIGSLRAVAAAVDGQGWKERLENYEKLVAAPYGDRATVDALQAVDDDVIKDGKAQITESQKTLNGLSEAIDTTTDEKSFYSDIIRYLGAVLTVVAFFVKSNT